MLSHKAESELIEYGWRERMRFTNGEVIVLACVVASARIGDTEPVARGYGQVQIAGEANEKTVIGAKAVISPDGDYILVDYSGGITKEVVGVRQHILGSGGNGVGQRQVLQERECERIHPVRRHNVARELRTEQASSPGIVYSRCRVENLDLGVRRVE